jgi:hypothetical protein
MYDTFPAQLHYYTERKAPKNSTGALLYEQAYFMLQYLQNTFLLNRVAIARSLASGQGLLENAIEMLDISLMFWIKRDELMAFSSGFDWIVSIHLLTFSASHPLTELGYIVCILPRNYFVIGNYLLRDLLATAFPPLV